MEDRYERIRFGCNPKLLKPFLLIIDEFADLSLQDKHWEFYDRICRLAQKSRSAKISIILATQRPGVDIVNGSIKANFPARIACRVASNVDSRVILDAPGAEHLLGKGDALLRDSERYLERFQVAYTTPEEVCRTFSV
jgi:S-DNA-T family DNA segregation ATPase FtsK/SpoIIIE